MNRTSATTRARAKILALALLLAAALAVVPASIVHADPDTFVINSTGDGADANIGDGTCKTATAGECTLRAAIQEANNTTDADTIEFDIPATDPNCDGTSGVCTIAPTTQLPGITEAVTIDGYSQSGASPNTLATGDNAALKIELDGSNAGAAIGIVITAPDSVVKGLVINRWDSIGVFVDNVNASGNRIEGNYIGTDASGTQDLGNGSGVQLLNAPDNVVGGTDPASRNVISGNDYGIELFGTDTSGNRIEGNYIGTDASGNADLGNSSDGVLLQFAPDNVVGGASAAARNVISGNFLGVEVSGNAATGNRILRNSIFGNDELGINLNVAADPPSRVTPNDTDDPDTGPNNLQNFPVITSGTTFGGETTIQGGLNSSPNDTFNLQFFSSPTADPSGFGEGETFVGQTNVTTNAGGTTTFSFTTSTPVAGGRVITATATNITTDDTSEFSRAVEVEDDTTPPPPPSQCSDGLDNDSDGKTDFGGANGDPGCESPDDDSESPDPPVSPPGCTIVGTPGDDTLVGTPRNDTICGLGGADKIRADSGNDTIKGGEGDDTMKGGSGTDTLQGGPGSDNLRGEAGSDALGARDGVRGNDTANGGPGSDSCSADARDRKVSCP